MVGTCKYCRDSVTQVSGQQSSGISRQAGAGNCAGLSTVRIQHTVRVRVLVVIFHVIRTEYQYGTVLYTLQELVVVVMVISYNILPVLYCSKDDGEACAISRKRTTNSKLNTSIIGGCGVMGRGVRNVDFFQQMNVIRA